MEISKPKGSNWTDDQWKAIVSSGRDILVAAAAGSGKTAVLVERIIRKITDQEHPVDVDSKKSLPKIRDRFICADSLLY